MGIFSSIFGGGTSKASEKSLKATQADNKARLDFIKRQAALARSDVLGLMPEAQRVAAEGTQGALDVVSGGLLEQLAALNQGNFLARQQLAQTQPQFQNAILGLPTQQFQPQQAPQLDLSFLQGLQAPVAQAPQQFLQQPASIPENVPANIAENVPANIAGLLGRLIG